MKNKSSNKRLLMMLVKPNSWVSLLFIAVFMLSNPLFAQDANKAPTQEKSVELTNAEKFAKEIADKSFQERHGIDPDELISYFQKAYTTYPNLPNGLLEALSYNTTRMAHHIPDEHHSNCSGNPHLYGIMALILDGKGIVNNTMKMAADASGYSIEEIIASPEINILATAAWLSKMGLAQNADQSDIESWFDIIQDYTGIPKGESVSSFVREDFTHQTLLAMNKGVQIKQHHFTLPNTSFKADDLVSSELLKIVEGKQISIPVDGAAERSADYAGATWTPTTCFSGRGGSAITDVVIHDMEGWFGYTVYTLFMNCAEQVSAHYCIRSNDGFIVQMIRESDRAWHIGNANSYAIGIEHEGFAETGIHYTDIMYETSAALVKDITQSGYGISGTSCYNGPGNPLYQLDVQPVSTKIKGHCHYPLSLNSEGHWDPGPFWNWAHYYDLINGCAGPTNGQTYANSITSNSARLNYAGPAYYALYEYALASSNNWQSLSFNTHDYMNVSGLNQGTQYKYRIATWCGTQWSSWSSPKYFTTLSSCSAPTIWQQNASEITSSSARLNYTGPATYAQYRYALSNSNNWSYVSYSADGSRLIYGLSASTNYKFQSSIWCGTTWSPWSGNDYFTTPAASASCGYDYYEPNDTYATNISPYGTSLYGLICPSGDYDWFFMDTYASLPDVRISLSSLPANYNIYLYGASGNFLGSSTNGGTASELITYNAYLPSRYFILVLGSGSAFNSYDSYFLSVSTSNNFRSTADNFVEDFSEPLLVTKMPDVPPFISDSKISLTDEISLSTFPNPTNGKTSILVNTVGEGQLSLAIYDVSSKLVKTISTDDFVSAGIHNFDLDASSLSNGTYLIAAELNGLKTFSKLIVAK